MYIIVTLFFHNINKIMFMIKKLKNSFKHDDYYDYNLMTYAHQKLFKINIESFLISIFIY